MNDKIIEELTNIIKLCKLEHIQNSLIGPTKSDMFKTLYQISKKAEKIMEEK